MENPESNKSGISMEALLAEMNEKGYFFIGSENISEENTEEQITKKAQAELGIGSEIELVPDLENEGTVFVFAKKFNAQEDNV